MIPLGLEKIVCWCDGDRCLACPHYAGKADHCTYRPETSGGRFMAWVRGRCSFGRIFNDG